MKNLLAVVFAVFSILTLGPAGAADKGTPDEAVAMVKKAVALIKAKGKDAALAEFNSGKAGGFVDRDLYIFVLDKDGVTVANGVNPRLVGKNVMQMKDVDGKFFIKKLIDIGDTKGHGWTDYKWSNQVTQAMEMKQSYVEKVDNLYVGCGVYQ